MSTRDEMVHDASRGGRPSTRRRTWFLPQVKASLVTAMALVLFGSMTVQQLGQVAEAAAAGQTFYVSPQGNDAAAGTSLSTAWRTLDRANAHVFTPGQQLLLQGGATFTGMLYLDAADAGDAVTPVKVGSFGTGRAVIRSAGTPGVYVYNTAGVVLRDLQLVGDAASYRSKGGSSFYNDLGVGRPRDGVTIAGVDVSGYRNGLEIGAADGSSDFRQVRISDANLHDNMETGLITYGPAFNPSAPTYAHSDVRVMTVEAHRNIGDPANRVRNTGSGIVLGSVSGGLIEGSTAHDNGSACVAPEGPAGIWTYDSREVVIQRNVSYHNRTGGGADGDGFDLDQNVSASTLQYNLSYGNDGAGYLIWTAQSSTAHRDNTVRFNVSSDDARKVTWYGGITVSGRMQGTQIYNNTIVTTGGSTARPAMRLDRGPVGVAIRNNIFVAETGPVVASPALSPAEVTMQGNDYVGTGGRLLLQWGATYDTLDAWRRATGAETLDGAASGHSLVPGLVDPRAPLAVQSPTVLAEGFKLSPESLVRGRGLDLAGRFGTSVGTTDHYGVALRQGATNFDIGAHQPSAALVLTDAAPVAPPPPPAAPVAETVLGPATSVVRQDGSTGRDGTSSTRMSSPGAGAMRLAITTAGATTLTASVVDSAGSVMTSRSGAGSVSLETPVTQQAYTVIVKGPRDTAFKVVTGFHVR